MYYFMKITSTKVWILLFILVAGWQFVYPQVATIKGKISCAASGKIYLIRPAYSFNSNNIYEGFKKISLNAKGEFTLSIQLSRPEIMKIIFNDSNGVQLASSNIYLTAGDKIKMESLKEKKPLLFKVTGVGALNNQMLAVDGNDSIGTYRGDTLPNRVIAYLRNQNQMHSTALNDYIQKNRPSAAFIKAWKINLQYEILDSYYSFSTNNAFQIGKAYNRNYEAWNNITQYLYKDAPLNNQAALVAANYQHFTNWYLVRTKEGLWDLFNTDRQNFLHEWYGKDTATGAAIFFDDRSNDLQQRIIEKYFTANVKDYLYAVLINGALVESEIKNLVPIYQKFKSDFPASQYLSLFEDGMKDIVAKKKRELTPEMKFIDGAGLFKKWEDILAYYKGQTILLDMWGTWCGPCRQDLDRHSAFIKQYFKGRPLTYLYIANNDTDREKEWKELIAYFNLEGNHFIAGKELTEDIMKKVKGQGFPTYVIIHKDGTFELYNRGFGIDRDVLIAQIENALKL